MVQQQDVRVWSHRTPTTVKAMAIVQFIKGPAVAGAACRAAVSCAQCGAISSRSGT